VAAPEPITRSVRGPDALRRLGAAIGRVAQAGDRVLLEGPFGAGKTTFVQGLAAGLGVRDGVGSPSFVLEQQHAGRLRLYHIDLYRLERLEPALLEELEEHLFGDGVAAVEWPRLLPAEVRAGAIVVSLEIVDDETRRVRIETDLARVREAAEAAG
jgi:tRNA threonylcarbamoyladenosine biosynthesis protein TsaE